MSIDKADYPSVAFLSINNLSSEEECWEAHDRMWYWAESNGLIGERSTFFSFYHNDVETEVVLYDVSLTVSSDALYSFLGEATGLTDVPEQVLNGSFSEEGILPEGVSISQLPQMVYLYAMYEDLCDHFHGHDSNCDDNPKVFDAGSLFEVSFLL